MLNLVGIQYLLGPQHWTSTIFQLGWGPKSPATYMCVKETDGGRVSAVAEKTMEGRS